MLVGRCSECTDDVTQMQRLALNMIVLLVCFGVETDSLYSD